MTDQFDTMPVACDNCDWTGTGADIETTVHMIHKLADRVDIGGVVPAGECPECGCLAYKVEAQAAPAPLTVWTVLHDSKYGNEIIVCASQEGAWKAKAQIARDDWSTRADMDLPDDHSALSDDEVTAGFFDGNEQEFAEIEQHEIEGSPALPVALDLFAAALDAQEWAATMGGWDAPCWKALRAALEAAMDAGMSTSGMVLPATPRPDPAALVTATIEAYNAALDNDDEDREGGPIAPNGDDYNGLQDAIMRALETGAVPVIKLTQGGR